MTATQPATRPQGVESRSPQRPDDLVVTAPALSHEQVRSAADRARVAGRLWAAAPAPERARRLNDAADALAAATEELTALVVREVGKPVAEAAGEVARSVAILRYYAQQVLDPDGATFPASPGGHGLVLARRRARGVAGLIGPWNFPLAIPVWKAAPALAMGNAVLLKPSSEAAACGLRLGEVLSAALPEDLFTVVTGPGETARALIANADVVSFTGSTAVGRGVAAAAASRGVPAQCEMGGLNASIVLPDADPEASARTVVGAAFGYAGQKCTATSRVIVVGDPARFVDALVAATRGLPVGDPADKDTVVGPVISSAARDEVLDAVAQARSVGGRMLTGGTAADRDGWFVEPTLVDRVDSRALLTSEEVFGPVCAVMPVADAESAVRVANAVQYGLTAAVFTRDLDRALELADLLDVGMVRVNAPTSGVDYYAPFGGEKASSYGQREQGKAALDFYSTTRTVTLYPHG